MDIPPNCSMPATIVFFQIHCKHSDLGCLLANYLQLEQLMKKGRNCIFLLLCLFVIVYPGRFLQPLLLSSPIMSKAVASGGAGGQLPPPKRNVLKKNFFLKYLAENLKFAEISLLV